jgi:hypothetical protein
MKQDPAPPGKDTPESGQDAPEPPAAASDASRVSDNLGHKAAQPTDPAADGGVVKTRRRRMIVYTLGAALAGLLAAWCLAVPMPDYLLYATPPIKADAVVLFLGPGEAARRQQVDELVAKGWAKFVIIPWNGEIFETRVAKALVTPEKTARMARAVRVDLNRRFVERTHVEVLQALELMKHIDAKRAIFVSSPYHMRRIKIMADRVFDGGTYEIAYLPTAYDPPHWPWFAHWTDVKWVVSEWVKIGWFFLYSPFV